jgi:hypothetical protein
MYNIIVFPDTLILIETDLYSEVVHAHTRGGLTARPSEETNKVASIIK